MHTKRFSKSIFIIHIMLAIFFAALPGKALASDGMYKIDFSDEFLSVYGICEDDGVLYFLARSYEDKRYLCALPLDTQEISWRIEVPYTNTVNPVINDDGMIVISSTTTKESYTITPAGTIIDTTYYNMYKPPHDRVVYEDGRIGWSNTEYGYSGDTDAIGYGGMILTGAKAIDLFGNVQWETETYAYKPPVVDKNGTVYYVGTSKGLMSYSRKGELLWSDNPHERDDGQIINTIPVIGSDGSIYVGTERNSVYRYSPTGSPDSSGVVLDIYEGDPQYYLSRSPLIIAQDSLLCWAKNGNTADKDLAAIQICTIPSKGYQEGALWPCSCHDNRRTSTTSAPIFYPITGQVLWNDAPRKGAVIRMAGTDTTWTTGENGSFSILMPYGTYTLEVAGADVTRTVLVDDAPVSGITFESDETYPFLWESIIVDEIYYYGYIPVYPAIDHNGSIIVGGSYIYSGNGRPGALISFSPDGTRNWTNGAPVDSPPVVGMDNSIAVVQGQDYALSYGELYIYQQNGARTFIAGDQTTLPAAIGEEGTAYVHNPETGIIGYDQTGQQVWQSETNVTGAPVIDQNGIVYVASGSVLTAFNSDGSIRWTYQAPDTIHEPALDSNLIFIGCEDRSIYSISRDGTLVGTYYLGTRIACAPAVDSDGSVYVGARNGVFYALNTNGSIKWQKQLDKPVLTTPIIAADGKIFAAGIKTVYVFDTDGTVYWQYDIPFESSAHYLDDSAYQTYIALDDNGILYCLSTYLNSLYAFQTDSPGIKTDAPWPCYRGNNQRTGRIGDNVISGVVGQEPQEFSLASNHPNPFNPTTSISFSLPSRVSVTLAVYSATGQQVATLIDDTLGAGAHTVVFDGAGLASGLYFYRIVAGRMTGTGKMLLVK